MIERVPQEQVESKIKQENPWWGERGCIPDVYNGLRPRPFLGYLYPLAISHIRRAIILMGPRRVGKTVLIFHLIQELLEKDKVSPPHVAYFSIDQPIYNGLKLEDFVTIWNKLHPGLEEQRRYMFFDEIQYLKNWEIHLKTVVDQYPNIKFLVSGSAAAALKLKSNESGAGRFTDFLLPPLTFFEYLSLKFTKKQSAAHKKGWKENMSEETLLTKYMYMEMPTQNDTNGMGKFEFSGDIEEFNQHFLDYLNFGGYPEVIFSKDIQRDADRYIGRDIVDKVLLRDLPSLYGIHNVQHRPGDIS
jgi:uncharacterized protein